MVWRARMPSGLRAIRIWPTWFYNITYNYLLQIKAHNLNIYDLFPSTSYTIGESKARLQQPLINWKFKRCQRGNLDDLHVGFSGVLARYRGWYYNTWFFFYYLEGEETSETLMSQELTTILPNVSLHHVYQNFGQ